MKQLSSSELNNLSREDMAAIILQMQQMQLQLQQQINTLNEKIAIMNARHFGRSTEKLEALPGQMKIFNEARRQRPSPSLPLSRWWSAERSRRVSARKT